MQRCCNALIPTLSTANVQIERALADTHTSLSWSIEYLAPVCLLLQNTDAAKKGISHPTSYVLTRLSFRPAVASRCPAFDTNACTGRASGRDQPACKLRGGTREGSEAVDGLEGVHLCL